MEDFVFGTLATDELKLIHHRASRRGLQHGFRITPRDPLPGQAVTIHATTGPNLNADHVACYYTIDDSQPAGSRGVSQQGEVIHLEKQSPVWDNFLWGYITPWEGVIPPQPDSTIVRYRLGAWSDSAPPPNSTSPSRIWGRLGGGEVFADWPQVQETIEISADAYFNDRPIPDVSPGDPQKGRTFAFGVDTLSPPDWAREAVIYQVFVDRFYPGNGKSWKEPDNLRGFFGGTLWGLAEKMDYVEDLGVNCLWLSPIFSSPTHHGYDVTDLYQVEERLGGDEALRAVIDEAHSRGIRIILDFVCNHISNYHPIFIDARDNPESKYRDWFTFDDSAIGYRTFFAVEAMPQVNVENPEARQWLIDAARYWLREFDIDGYRLDYAIGPAPGFWIDFWAGCKAENPDCFCFGEMIDSPAMQQTYLGKLDGCLDFYIADALRRTYALDSWTEEKLEHFLKQHEAYFPDNFLMPTFLDNHDMDRFLFLAQGDKTALRRAAAAQMQLSGPPIIYYGTEVGLTHEKSTQDGGGIHVSRVPMLWGEEQDGNLLEFYKEIIRARETRKQ